MHNYTIGPTNWDYKEVSVIKSLRGDAVTRIVYRRTDRQTARRTDGRTDGQTYNGVSHKLDWSRPVELKIGFFVGNAGKSRGRSPRNLSHVIRSPDDRLREWFKHCHKISVLWYRPWWNMVHHAGLLLTMVFHLKTWLSYLTMVQFILTMVIMIICWCIMGI